MSLHVAWERVGEGPPLLLIQGLGYARWGWEPVVPLLARSFDVLLFDNRGIGASDTPLGPYTTAAMAGDALQVLDEAGVERAHVLGTSLGGMIAQELALTAPHRVDRLVLACTTPGGPRAHAMPSATVDLMLRRATLREFTENALEPAVRPELVERIVAHREAEAQGYAAWSAQAAAGAGFDAYDRLGALSAPTLVLHGDGDTVVDRRNAELLAELLPDARLSIYEGLGHLFFWNEPERFAREVTEFLLLTLDRWIRDRARATPDRVAIDFCGRELSYAELDERSERLAAGLAAAGLHAGDRVATLTGTNPEHVVVFFACAKAGLVLVPLNWRLAGPELAYQLGDAEPAVLLHDGEHAQTAAGLHDRSAGLEELAADGGYLGPAPADDDGLLLVYTSGTTGRPKGALLTHANCFWTNLAFDLATGVSGDDVVLAVLPQFHCGGWNVHPLLAWWKGARVVLEPSFDASRALSLIAAKRVTTMMGVPANYLFMAQDSAFASADLSSLRRAVVGGAPMPEALLDTWAERGVEIVQGYGLTEAAPNVLVLPPEDAARKRGCAGKPYPHVDVELREPETGAVVVGPGEGELVVRGPNVFAGYWRNPDATAEALAGGWLHTGDVAQRDDEGYYRIVGRTKDVVISGGENVYPAEIENVLHEHAAVAEAAVVGVPDERWGEVGLAFVALRGETTEEELLAFCRERLARYKVPKGVRFVDALPRNAMNKVAKAELLELVA